jgi:Secretion system C-terminal sorting domain
LFNSEKWDGTNWETRNRQIYTYNSEGNLSLFVSEKWNGTKWEMSNYTAEFNHTAAPSYGYYGARLESFYKNITDVNDALFGITDYSLSKNYPNPFNPSTKIKYQIPANVSDKGLNTKLIVYDILGNKVTTLVDKQQNSGNYEVSFNANSLTSGIYFYKLQSGNFVETKKMMLIK